MSETALFLLIFIPLVGVISRQIWQINKITIRHRHSLAMMIIKIIGVAIFIGIAVIYGDGEEFYEHFLLIGFILLFSLSYLTIGLAENVLFLPKNIKGGSTIGFKITYDKIDTCTLIIKPSKIQCRVTLNGKRRSLFFDYYTLEFDLDHQDEVIDFLEERGVRVGIEEKV